MVIRCDILSFASEPIINREGKPTYDPLSPELPKYAFTQLKLEAPRQLLTLVLKASVNDGRNPCHSPGIFEFVHSELAEKANSK